MNSTESGTPQMWMGHVNLRVSDVERSIRFYCDVFGFEVKRHRPGSPLAFLGVGGAAFQLGLDESSSKNGSPASPGSTGLDHIAIHYPTRKALATAARRLLVHGVQIVEADDHHIGESIYCLDPDENMVEIYWERPSSMWQYEEGMWRSAMDPLDLDDLLGEIERSND